METTKKVINYLNQVKIMGFMKCFTCKKQAETALAHLEPLCATCFSRIIEKRVRKNARINKLFQKNDRILVLDDLSHHMVNAIVKDLPKKLFQRKRLDENFIKKNLIKKIVIPWTLDDEINSFLESMLLSKKIKASNRIKLFKDTTEEELDLFCRFNKLKYKKNKKNKEIAGFLEESEKRYSGTKFKLLKSSERLSGLL